MLACFDSIAKRSVLIVAILYLCGGISTMQAADSIKMPKNQAPSGICQNDLFKKNKAIRCIAIDRGIVIAPKESFSQAVSDFESARMRFQNNVVMTSERIALIVGLVNSDASKDFMRKSGFFALVLPTSRERQDMIRAGLAKAVKDVNPDIKAKDAEKFVEQALARSIGQNAAASLSETGFAQHEICHTWLNAYVYSRIQKYKPLPRTHAAYGTALPDWLDEAIAVSCENETDRNRRRNDFRRTQAADAVIPLADLLKMQHPSNSRISDSQAQAISNAKTDVTVTVQIRDSGTVSPATAFYSQSYIFLDFLKDISTKQDVFRMIVDEFVKDGDPLRSIMSAIKHEQESIDFEKLNSLWQSWLLQNVNVNPESGARGSTAMLDDPESPVCQRDGGKPYFVHVRGTGNFSRKG